MRRLLIRTPPSFDARSLRYIRNALLAALALLLLMRLYAHASHYLCGQLC